MQAQLAIVAGLHSTAVCNHNQTMAPIYSSVANAQDTEHLGSTEKHIQDINLKETASRKVVKNSYTNDIVQAFTENDTQVEAIDTKTDAPMNHTADAKPRDCMVFFFVFLRLHNHGCKVRTDICATHNLFIKSNT